MPSREAKTPLPERPQGNQGRLSSYLRAARLGASPIEALVVVALIGGSLLILAEFLNLYTVERGAVVVAERTAGDNHAYSLLVAGIAVIVAALAVRASGAWPPAAAIAVLGLGALGVALIGDLPDATSSGLTADVRLAKAEPAIGLWIELIGAAIAALSGLALALVLRRQAGRTQAPRRDRVYQR